MPLIYINDYLFDRIGNDFCEDDDDLADGIHKLLKFYDENINEDEKND